MVCTHMLSRHLPTAYGGIGAITLMVGAVILTMAGDGTVGTVRAGALAGAAGTVVAGTAEAGGDTIITIIPDIIPVAVAIGEVAVIGEIPIQTDAHLGVLVEIGFLPMEEIQRPDVLLM